MELWERIKLESFSRAFTSAYMLALIVLFIHTQLNLLGRFIYLDSIPDPSGIKKRIRKKQQSEEYVFSNLESPDRETERKFLTFSWFLLNRSWQQCRDLVDAAVDEVVQPYVVSPILTHI